MKKLFLFSVVMAVAALPLFSQNADSAKVYFNKGMDEKNARRYMVSAKYFDKAIAFNSKYTDAFIENGKMNLEMHRMDAAALNFSKASQLEPNNGAVIKELTTLYFNNRQFQKAIEFANKCKECTDADRIVAISYYNLEDYGKAVTGIQKVLAKNPKDAEAAYTLGRNYVELDDYKNAISAYEKAVASDATKTSSMYELGLIYYNENDFKKALKLFNMAADAGYTKSNDFLENVGFAYLAVGDVTNGMKNLNIILERKPNNKELLGDIAQGMYGAKHYDDAISYYQKLLELNPKDASSLYMAGMCFQKKGQKEKGQAICDKAISMDPGLAKNRTKMGDQVGL